MKCSKCGKEFDGNFCPQCGNPANTEERKEDNVREKKEKSERSQEVKKKPYNKISSIAGVIIDIIITLLLLRYNVHIWLIFALWIVVIADIILERKKQNRAQRVLTVISALLVLLAFYEVYNGYQCQKYVNMVQKQKYMDVSYEKLFDHFSKDLSWKCTDQGRFTMVDPKESDRSGSYEAVVSVSGGCYVGDKETTYQLKFNVSKEENRVVATDLDFDGTSYGSTDEIDRFLNSVYRDYLGNDSDSTTSTDLTTEDSSTLDETSTIEADEDDSLERDSDVWFITYNSFYRTRDIGGIEINVMNDAVMFVQCTGSDGTVAEWEMNLKPAEMGDDGEYIYYYGKGIKMSYYPSDHHIHVDGEDNYFGDYYPNE